MQVASGQKEIGFVAELGVSSGGGYSLSVQSCPFRLLLRCLLAGGLLSFLCVPQPSQSEHRRQAKWTCTLGGHLQIPPHASHKRKFSHPVSLCSP